MVSYQIACNMTTNEVVNWHRLLYMVHPEDQEKPPYSKRKLNSLDHGPIKNCAEFWALADPGKYWKERYMAVPIYEKSTEV
ncbi:hypothetical protein HDU83_006965 [Entophlyctis luteolus]|nr:hypothetical protein HDU83_006965 [Entophlyctis luteolus]